MASQKKIDLVEKITNNLQDKQNFILLRFEKTNHQTLEGLRRNLKKSSSSLDVLKNSLFEKAINKLSSGNKTFIQLRKKFFPLKNSSAVMFLGKEWNQGLSSFYQFAQKEKTLGFKFSFLDGQLYDQNETERIAKLPGKDQLIGKIIGSFKNPSQRLVYSMKYNMMKMAMILDQKSKKQ